MSVSSDTFNCDDVGDNEVVLTVIDVNGNEASCGSTVTVTNAAPVITSTGGPYIVLVDGAAGATPNNGVLTASASDSDNSILTYTWSNLNCVVKPSFSGNNDNDPAAIVSFTAGTEPTICSISLEVSDVCTSASMDALVSSQVHTEIVTHH